MGDLNLDIRTAKPLADNYNKGHLVSYTLPLSRNVRTYLKEMLGME